MTSLGKLVSKLKQPAPVVHLGGFFQECSHPLRLVHLAEGFGGVEEFLTRGASKLWEVPGKTRPIAWTVLADPEGNEFCVFPES